MSWYFQALSKYAVFRGRATRKEFWMFLLISYLVMVLVAFLQALVGLRPKEGPGPLVSLYQLAVVVPTLAAGARRLHDTGSSGRLLYLLLFPFVGPLWLLIHTAQKGDAGANRYGPSPEDDRPEDDLGSFIKSLRDDSSAT